MATELASCVQFQGRVTIYFFPLPLFLRPQAEPTYVSRVFQFVRLKSKESIKERQNKEVKRTKTKSLEAQTSVTKKRKEEISKKKEKEKKRKEEEILSVLSVLLFLYFIDFLPLPGESRFCAGFLTDIKL